MLSYLQQIDSIELGWVNVRGTGGVFALDGLLQSDFLCEPLEWVPPLQLLKLLGRVLG